MTDSRSLPWLIIAQLLVTLALIAFAASSLVPSDTRQVIVGAVISNWLYQGHQLGQQVSETRAAPSTAAVPSAQAEG